MQRHGQRVELSELYPEGKKSSKLFEADDAHDDGEPSGFAHLVHSGHAMQVVELSKSGHNPKLWLHSPTGDVSRVRDGSEGVVTRSLRGWRRLLFAAFLPADFPNSVSGDYLAYQTYDSLQAFFSTITSLLANRALLQGLGVGDANSTATFALLLTILRDGVSHVVTIGFAHRFGLRIEPEAKKYRFLADLFNDSAFFLELYSPYLGAWAKAAALCAAEGLRAVCGVAAGASKAALSLHFARNDNLSELSAKEASQETAVSLVGLLVGTVVVRVVQDSAAVVYLVAALSLAHLWTNYRGVRSVCMTSVNKQRATILYGRYLASSVVCTPQQVAEEERILFWRRAVGNARGEPVFRVDFATDYADATGRGCKDVVAVDGPMHTRFYRPYRPGRPGRVRILLWDGAEAKHAVLAWFMAMDTAWVTDADAPYGDARADDDAPKAAAGTGRAKAAQRWRPRAREDELWRAMEAHGWDLNVGAMESGPGVRLGVKMTRRKAE